LEDAGYGAVMSPSPDSHRSSGSQTIADLRRSVLHELGDGVHVVVKKDCATCVLVAPVLTHLMSSGALTTVSSQDDATFPDLRAPAEPFFDADLRRSFALDIETVPTLVRIVGGIETDRIIGWRFDEWQAFLGGDLGADASTLPSWRPGCGSTSLDIGVPEQLAVRFGVATTRSRHVELASAEDEHEAMYARGWTDGLPVVAPTQERVLRMLAGISRRPDEIVAIVPPTLVECSVEKVAVNAVLAGCRPEYLPVVLAAVEAACSSTFNAHGLLATTYFSGPVLVVNGPVATDIGMNSGVNVFGQGNRANATIGRALQLVIRNVGGGVPGGVDRATFGNPGKVGFAFAETETAAWGTLANDQGMEPGVNAVTLFAGEAPQGIVDQKSRTADSLVRSFAACLRTVAHPKLPMGFDALVAISPEHLRTFRSEGWDRSRLRDELLALLQLPGAEIVRGAGGIEEGVPIEFAGHTLAKFRPDGLLLVHCGGDAGMFSAVIGGWVNGAEGSEPITVAIDPWR
jgi:hypothetical protein